MKINMVGEVAISTKNESIQHQNTVKANQKAVRTLRNFNYESDEYKDANLHFPDKLNWSIWFSEILAVQFRPRLDLLTGKKQKTNHDGRTMSVGLPMRLKNSCYPSLFAQNTGKYLRSEQAGVTNNSQTEIKPYFGIHKPILHYCTPILRVN